MIAIVHAQGLLSAALTIGLTLIFIVCMLTIVRPLFVYATQRMRSKELLTTLSIIMLLLSAYITNELGIHPAFGAFLLGIILPREALFGELVKAVGRVNAVLFLPLYFVYSGLHTQIGLISTVWLWLICLLVLVIACVGKISGSMFAARLVGESWHTSLSLGILMNTRGLVELIVLNIGLELGVFSPTFFSMLVVMAVITTMMTAPLLALLGYKQNRPPETGQMLEDNSLQEHV